MSVNINYPADTDIGLPANSTLSPSSTVTGITNRGATTSNIAGRQFKRASSMSFPIRPVGYPANSSSTEISWHMAMELPFEYMAWRVTIYQYANATPDYKVGLASGTSVADLYGNSATPTIATFGGVGHVAAVGGSGTGTAPNHTFGIVQSDLMIDSAVSGAKMLYLRTDAQGANNTIMNGWTALNGLPYGAQTAYQLNFDGVTNWSGFTSPITNRNPVGFPPVLLELFGPDQIVKGAVFGSSNAYGQGDDQGWGLIQRTQQKLNLVDTTKAWTFANLSAPGSTTNASIIRATTELQQTPYNFALFWVYSSNDTDKDTYAGRVRRRGQMIKFIEQCNQSGVDPWLVTFQPGTSLNAATYAECKQSNNDARALAAAGHCRLLDISNLVSDETASVPTYRNPAWTSDGTHLSALGCDVVSTYAQSLLSSCYTDN